MWVNIQLARHRLDSFIEAERRGATEGRNLHLHGLSHMRDPPSAAGMYTSIHRCSYCPGLADVGALNTNEWSGAICS